MRGVKSVVLALALALALSAAGACEAKLEGAPCPCLEPEYMCVDEVCRRARDGGPDFPDASFGAPDAGIDGDGGGGSPDASPSSLDASLL